MPLAHATPALREEPIGGDFFVARRFHGLTMRPPRASNSPPLGSSEIGQLFLYGPLAYWRTTSQFEVDFILGHDVAVEVKSTTTLNSQHRRGLKAFQDEYPGFKRIIVSLDSSPQKWDGIRALPWKHFLEELWSGKLIS